MTPIQIDLLRDSFVNVMFARQEATTLFYDRLFALAPGTRALFQRDMDEQGRLLIGALAKLVAALDRFDDMLPGLRDLAIRHVGYGVREEDYRPVGMALLHMIESLSGPSFDEATAAAWRDVYAKVSAVMIAAARERSDPIQTRAA